MTVLALASAMAIAINGVIPQPVGMPIHVDADRGAAYFAKCHIRTFRDQEGVYGNIFFLERQGPISDRIPSPNAQCWITKTKGPGSVTLHILKNGDHSVTVNTVMEWKQLKVW